jgi:site-specific recombinase XerD
MDSCATKEKDLDKAKKAAREIYLDAQYRVKYGIPAQSKRFKDVARLAVDRMKKAIAGGEGRRVYRDYIQAIDNYLIPFFGNHHIDHVTYPMLQQFAAWRNEKLGKEPKSSTINTHNSALNRIFDEALMHGYIAKTQVPVLINKGRDAERRPDFTREEYRKLYRALTKWAGEGRQGKSRDMRELLRDYVLILSNTGMRHGTEAQNLRWKHITTFEKDGRSYVAMYVKGKTRGRELIARHNCLIYLKRIHQRCRDIADMTFEELLASKLDKHVFRLPDATITNSLNQTFRHFMKDSGLLKDQLTGHNRTLYSLRHTYATFQVIGGVDLHLLAKQMGTSIAMLEAHYSHLQPRLRAETLAAGGDDTSEKKPLRPTTRPRPISPVELQAMSDDELTNKFKQQ